MSETKPRPFISRAEYWGKTVADGQGLLIRPAKLSKPNGLPEDGVAVCVDNWPRLVLRREDAERLADMLADFLDAS